MNSLGNVKQFFESAHGSASYESQGVGKDRKGHQFLCVAFNPI